SRAGASACAHLRCPASFLGCLRGRVVGRSRSRERCAHEGQTPGCSVTEEAMRRFAFARLELALALFTILSAAACGDQAVGDNGVDAMTNDPPNPNGLGPAPVALG